MVLYTDRLSLISIVHIANDPNGYTHVCHIANAISCLLENTAITYTPIQTFLQDKTLELELLNQNKCVSQFVKYCQMKIFSHKLLNSTVWCNKSRMLVGLGDVQVLIRICACDTCK